MFADVARERFRSMVSLDDADIDLLAACLLIAQEEYPAISIAEEVQRVRAIARELADVAQAAHWIHAVHALNHIFFVDHGFHADPTCFEDPDAAYLNRVLQTGRGLPIALSILYVEIGRRAGLPLSGVAFPGHFLVRLDPPDGAVFLDPYHGGRMLLAEELARLLRQLRGRHAVLQREHLLPAGNKRILLRLLANLKRSYLQSQDYERALHAVERMLHVDPERISERRDRGLLYGQTGRRESAIADLREYLDARPQAPDAERVRRVLLELLAERGAEA
jgi:regulator of sirC expression with transglutaminase-like and TPR domain